MSQKLLREITPLTSNDCFTIFSRTKSTFDFPLHYHEEFELNFIQNAKGAKRVVGDHIDEIDDFELVLIGSNLQHGWFTNKCESSKIKEVTIQFHRNLFDERFLQRNQMLFIRNILEKSMHGVCFSKVAIQSISCRLIELPQKHGFDSVLELLSILHDLSTSRNIQTLSNSSFNNIDSLSYNSRRVDKIMSYLNSNFDKNISLGEAAKIAGMTRVALSRFFKLKTGKTFVDTLNEVRLGNASRMLIDTTYSISEIAYKCGFNNISNFNKTFLKKKNYTPKEFRKAYTLSGIRTFI